VLFALVRMLLVAGFLHGALLYGTTVSALHLFANRPIAVGDSLVLLAYCALLYGAASAAVVSAVGLVAAIAGRRGADVGRGALWAGLGVFTFGYWFLFFNYGLTYDELPFAAGGRAAMLAYLAARTLLIAFVAASVARLLAAGWLVLSVPRRARGVALLALAALAIHVALPFGWRPTEAAALRATASVTHLAPEARIDTEPLKVVLIGIDGADWRVIRPLVAAGRLPNFAALIERGSAGPLTTLQDANSAMIWASIYTGRSVRGHGIEDFYRIRLAGMRSDGVFPVHRTSFKELAGRLEPIGLAERLTMYRGSLRVPPIWDVLDGTGMSTGIVDGYYFSYPARAPLVGGSYVLAYGLAEAYRRARGHDRAPDAAALADYAQPPAVLADVGPELERDEFHWQAATTLRLLGARPQPRLLSMYTRQPDNEQHRSWRWYQPQHFIGVDRKRAARLGERIPQLHEEIDAFLGALRAHLDPATVLVVVSDHGHSPTLLHAMDTQHRHGPPGIVLMAGGPVRAGQWLARAHVLDVFPTILHLLGLPVPQDGDGRVLTEALDPVFLARAPVRTVPSYGGLARDGGESRVEQSPRRNAEEIEKLRALGYVR
jgi:hypothetical protein